MELWHTNSPASSAAALSSPAARRQAAAVQSNKLTCLRRYVSDNAARRLIDKCAAGAPTQLHEGEHTYRRRGWVGSCVDANASRREKKMRLRNGSGIRLVHDTLGEAEAPLPRVSVGQCSASGLPSSSSRKRAAASFDALQFGRMQRPRAGGKAEAYSLAAEEGQFLDSHHSPGGDELNGGLSLEEERSCDSADSDDEAVVIVDNMGQNVCCDHAQQRQVKALLKAEEQTLQSTLDAGKRSAQSETGTISGALPAWRRSHSVERKHSVSAAVNTSRQEALGRGGATRVIGCTKEAASIVTDQNLGNLGSKHKKTETCGLDGASDDLRYCEERRHSGGTGRNAGGESKRGDSEERDCQRGVNRLCQVAVHLPIDKDGDLCFSRRKYDQRLSQDKVERGGRSHVAGRSSSSFAVEEQRISSFPADKDECDGRGKISVPLHSDTDVSPCEQRPHFLDGRAEGDGQRSHAVVLNRSNAEACRNAAGTANVPARLPGACEPSATELVDVRRSLTANALVSSTCEGNSSSPEDEAGLISKKAHATVLDGARRVRRTEGGMRVETASRGSGESSSGSSAGALAPGETKRHSEGIPSPKAVVYRDRDGRIITEEEWLELKDPLTRRRTHEKLKKERPPRVQLAWGGGLVQQVEKAQTAAEEALLAQQPLARYELDADFDLELQRKQRWDDPVAKVPGRCCSPQEDGAASSTAEVNAHPEAPVDGVPRRATDKPRCPFDAPKNRFGIEPGYRWDGVVRGNGYEDRRLEAINKRRLEERLKHTNNVADM